MIMNIVFNAFVFLLAVGGTLFVLTLTQVFYRNCKVKDRFIKFGCRSLQVIAVLMLILYCIIHTIWIIEMFFKHGA